MNRVQVLRSCLRNAGLVFSRADYCSLAVSSSSSSSCASSPQSPSVLTSTTVFDYQDNCLDSRNQATVNLVAAKACVGSSPDEILISLAHDKVCNDIEASNDLVDKLLLRFKDDWKSALGVFRWAGLRPGYKHRPEAYDMMVDILGKMKQMDRMKEFLEEMNRNHLVTLNTVGKAMRRFSGAGKWEDAVRMFDELGTFGLEKNTESMNLLLDTLCKEGKVEQARAIFLELKSHILPNAHTFNIFIHGWCKANLVDEAHWTLQEMKGHACRPCVISYSTIIQFYCRRYNFSKVYELLDEMEAQGCPPNAVTYTTVTVFLVKSQNIEEALQLTQRMKSAGCKPDTPFFNSLIYLLGRAGRFQEAVDVFEKEMSNAGVSRDTSTYNSMIAIFCHHGHVSKALSLLKEMQTSALFNLDGLTFYPLLKSCLRTGDMDLLSQLLDDMVKKHQLSLDRSAYALLIHGLCRANKCEWAYHLFEEMIGKDIVPKYQTCHLLLEEVKLKSMYDTAEKIEEFMKKL
ncbi:hypothetical protein OIU79_006997 [Salix purpurea]|uniref:PROP1-like PPR domain-containing protein n=1 Tax=Salix purpurea TaxID=77065 RepID=A0A9Q0Z2P6_SALPP|nr:hypothetical protein OIU79_006997 [Salix purpurea]